MNIWINIKYSKCLIILAIQVLLFVNQVLTDPDEEYCNVCLCMEDVISCTNRHFKHIPSKINETVKYLKFLKVTFDKMYLEESDFLKMTAGKCCPRLTRIYIRQTNINLIKYRSFKPFSKLDLLEILTKTNLRIENEAFYGLRLTLLTLQSPDLNLQINVFRGASIKTLKIANTSLTHLEYDLIKPLMPSLIRLVIDKNKIKVLDYRFGEFFKRLIEFNMINNPLDCRCSMKWLKDVFEYRKSRGLTLVSSFNKTHLIPKCAQPFYLKGQQIHQISYHLFNCDKPMLNTLKIDFTTFHTSSLTCHANHPIDRSNMLVKWLPVNANAARLNTMDIATDQYLRQIDDTIQVKQKSSIDIYKCVAKNVNGNVSAVVRITWPNVSLNATNLNTQTNKNKWTTHNSNLLNNDENSDDYLFQKRFTLLEMLGAVIGTFTLTLLLFLFLYKLLFIKHNKKSLFLPQKSNNSNITNSNIHQSNSNSNNIGNNINGAFYNDNNLGINGSMLLSNNSYTTYDAAVYNESLTYDIPGNSMGTNLINKTNNLNASNNDISSSNPSHHNAMLTMPNLCHNNYSVNSCSNTPEHFLDFKTQRKLYKP